MNDAPGALLHDFDLLGTVDSRGLVASAVATAGFNLVAPGFVNGRHVNPFHAIGGNGLMVAHSLVTDTFLRLVMARLFAVFHTASLKISTSNRREKRRGTDHHH